MTRVPRRLETKYWLEDKVGFGFFKSRYIKRCLTDPLLLKEKDKRRKTMVAKLLKGRKKMKFRGLTLEQEENFHAMLDSLDTMSPIKCDKLSNGNSSDTKVELSSDSSVKDIDVTAMANADSCLEESALPNDDTSKTDLKLFGESFGELDWAPLPKTPVVNKETEKKAGKSRRESRKSVRRASSLFKSIKTENTLENMVRGMFMF